MHSTFGQPYQEALDKYAATEPEEAVSHHCDFAASTAAMPARAVLCCIAPSLSHVHCCPREGSYRRAFPCLGSGCQASPLGACLPCSTAIPAILITLRLHHTHPADPAHPLTSISRRLALGGTIVLHCLLLLGQHWSVSFYAWLKFVPAELKDATHAKVAPLSVLCCLLACLH